MKLASIALMFVVACGGSDGTDTGECVDLCTEGQDGNCTTIQGSCSAFCNALDGVQDDAGCTDERAAYQSCLADTPDVCDSDCDSEEAAMNNCIDQFCAANLTNQDCQTLASSF